MKYMKAIAAVDCGWGIGNKGELLANVKADMKHFREITTGKTVVLGSKTLSTFPNGKPLKNRRNIIMSRRQDYKVEGGEVAHSVEELLGLIENDPCEVVVIGGDSIYKQLLPYCDTVYITKFDRDFDKDAFFPNLDADKEWFASEVGEEQLSAETDSVADMGFRFVKYKRK